MTAAIAAATAPAAFSSTSGANVRIYIERHPRRCMTEPISDDLWAEPLLKHQVVAVMS